MADQLNTTTRKIGMNRGKPRLWLEGKVLTDAGFDHGDRWTLTNFHGCLTLTKDVDGKRKVSGKPGRPVIDMAGATISGNGFAHGDTVKVVIGTARLDVVKLVEG